MMRKFSTLFLSTVLALSIAACGGGSKKKTTPGGGGDGAGGGAGATGEKSLFDRLGGLPAITAVIEGFLGKVVADDRINARFANTDAAHLKQMLIDQVCAATGGPCKYTGKDMVTAHTGMNVTEEEFTALVEDLKATLDEAKVPAKEQGELLGALGGMKGDIVGK